MQRFIRVFALLASVLLFVWLVAACGGDGDGDKEQPTATEAAATRTEAPDVKATEEPEKPEATEPSVSSMPFDSFHYTVDMVFTIAEPGQEEETLINGQIEGDFVAPDSHAFTNSFRFAFLSRTKDVVIIGNDAWLREGSGDWVHVNRSSPDVMEIIDLSSADPGFLQDTDLAEGLASLDSEPETINGVNTRRYHIPKEAVQTLANLLGDEFLEDASGLQEFEMTVWLEEETSALVRAELDAIASPDLIAGADTPFDLSPDATLSISMTINVTQINDPDIVIEPPL